MNIQTPPTAFATADDFLAWNEGREGRREFVNGRVIEMMTGVSKNHNRIATNLVVTLASLVDRRLFDVGTADYGIRTTRGIRYPDLYVERKGERGQDLASAEPLFLAEILSPSSLAIDFGPKVQEYLEIETLRHYAVLSQDEPRVWVWHREEAGFEGPDILLGKEAFLTLSAFDARIALADLYHDVA